MPKISTDPNAQYITYFVQSACGRFVKIGTTCDLEKRLYSYRHEYNGDRMGDNPRVLGYIPGALDVEGEVHRKFVHYRQSFEGIGHLRPSDWFILAPELVEFILTETRLFTSFAQIVGACVPVGATTKSLTDGTHRSIPV